MCLDITLETAISFEFDPDTRLRKYPLATLRYNYINSFQPRRMAMSTFISTLKKKAKEADKVGLQPEQLFSLM